MGIEVPKKQHVCVCMQYPLPQVPFHAPMFPPAGPTCFSSTTSVRFIPKLEKLCSGARKPPNSGHGSPQYIYIFAVNSIALRVTFLGLLVGSAEHRPNTPSSAPPWLHARGPPNRPVESSEVWNDQKCSKNVPVAHLRVARVFEVRGARSFWGDRSRSRGARQEPCSEEQGECRHHKERGICAAATRLGGV